MSARSISDIDSAIAKRVQFHRKRRGMSQIELGKRVGVTFQQVQKYESGSNRIGSGRLFQIASTLNVPVESLFPASPNLSTDTTASTEDEWSAFLLTADGRRLCQAFLQINNSQVRKRVIALVESMVAPSADDV